VPAELTVRGLQPPPPQQRAQRVLAEHPAQTEGEAGAEHGARDGRAEPQLGAEERARREVQQGAGHEGDRAQPVRHREDERRHGPAELRGPAVRQQSLRFQEQDGRGGAGQQGDQQGKT
jgi:hypothetical protein